MPTKVTAPRSLAIVRAGSVNASLQTRIVGLAESLSGPSWMAILLEAGSATILDGPTPDTIDEPTLVWRPWSPGRRLSLAPGSVASYVLIGPTALANAIGHKPESRELRDLADRGIRLAVRRDQAVFETLRICFSAIYRETQSESGAARSLVEAYLRILLIELWRIRRQGDPGSERLTPSQRHFNRFTTLVELHFRDRWTVESYADALGLSRDRLGDICFRIRGRSPKEILDRRIALEARLLLTDSTHSIEQISGLLGFQSAAQFNRFFRRTAGLPPGRFRRSLPETGDDRAAGTSPPLHDWP